MTGGSGIELLYDAKNKLGESPVWDPHLNCLWWIDCVGRALLRYDLTSGQTTVVPVGSAIHAIGVRSTGGLVAAMTFGFCTLNPETGAHSVISVPEADRPDFHFNDGKCGPDNRFWVGSMHKSYNASDGQVFKLGPDDVCATMMTGFTVPNGLGWSPDLDFFYIADSPSGAIFKFDYERHGGSLRRRQIAVAPGEAPGWPDGMSVDTDGCLWSVRWDGGCVVRFTPDGAVDRVVDLPVTRPTSCAFGGPNLDILFITSGTAGMEDAALADEPQAGGLFAIRPGVQGVPVGTFDGPSSFWHPGEGFDEGDETTDGEEALEEDEEEPRRKSLFKRWTE